MMQCWLQPCQGGSLENLNFFLCEPRIQSWCETHGLEESGRGRDHGSMVRSRLPALIDCLFPYPHDSILVSSRIGTPFRSGREGIYTHGPSRKRHRERSDRDSEQGTMPDNGMTYVNKLSLLTCNTMRGALERRLARDGRLAGDRAVREPLPAGRSPHGIHPRRG